MLKYCKSGNFCENFIVGNSVKRHFCDAKNSQLGHDLHISVNNRVISAFRKDFFRESITLAKISEFTVFCLSGQMTECSPTFTSN